MKDQYRRLTQLHRNPEAVLGQEHQAVTQLRQWCQADCPPPAFSIATYNLWGSQHEWARRRPRIVSLLQTLQPSVVALQEVHRLGPGCLTLDEVQEAAGYPHSAFAPSSPAALQPGAVEEGLGLLSRFPVVHHAAEPLPPSPASSDRNSRIVLHAIVNATTAGVGLVHVFATHLTYDAQAQCSSMVHLFKHVTRTVDASLAPQAQVFVLGDFNTYGAFEWPWKIVLMPASDINRHGSNPCGAESRHALAEAATARSFVHDHWRDVALTVSPRPLPTFSNFELGHSPHGSMEEPSRADRILARSGPLLERNVFTFGGHGEGDIRGPDGRDDTFASDHRGVFASFVQDPRDEYPVLLRRADMHREAQAALLKATVQGPAKELGAAWKQLFAQGQSLVLPAGAKPGPLFRFALRAPRLLALVSLQVSDRSLATRLLAAGHFEATYATTPSPTPITTTLSEDGWLEGHMVTNATGTQWTGAIGFVLHTAVPGPITINSGTLR